MNNLQIFENPDFGQVRMVMIEDNPYFVGKDVAEILGYKNPNEAIQDHVDNEDKFLRSSMGSEMLKLFSSVKDIQNKFGRQDNWFINESGVYSLIFSSKLPKAKEFKHWVTSEVLPAIRKTGSYSQPKRELPTPKRSILEIQTLENVNDLEVRIMKSVGDNADIETMIGYAIVQMAVERGLYTADLAATCLNRGVETYIHTRR